MQTLKRIKKNWNCAESKIYYCNNAQHAKSNANGNISYSNAMCQVEMMWPNWTTTTTTTATTKTEKSTQTKCSNNNALCKCHHSRRSRNQQSVPPAEAVTTKATATRASSIPAATTTTTKSTRLSCHSSSWSSIWQQQQQGLPMLLAITILIIFNAQSLVKADEATIKSRISRYTTTITTTTTAAAAASSSSISNYSAYDLSTTPMPPTTTTKFSEKLQQANEDWQPINGTKVSTGESASPTASSSSSPSSARSSGRANDSIFLRFARHFSTGNELWDGIITDCYTRPTFTCFQKNVYGYLSGALDEGDVNITQRVKFYKNQIVYDANAQTTESAIAKDAEDGDLEEESADNDIPSAKGRARLAALAETPIEEVTKALYGKSIKFAMTHDLELQLPEMLFDGATFRISPRAIEGNGIVAKLELIPKQVVEARLAGKIIMKKIQKFLRSKLLLSFLALLVIIKIIKIKLFWLLPLIIGVGAAKKLLLKFLLFLFPALSHLFKLCSYYQQSYHTTKFHHHHHLINHHHTVVPAWHNDEHHGPPEIIYTNPPKGHISTYLHGAPIHETYGPHGLEHIEGAWENSGPGLGTEYISDINRVAQIEDNTNYFKPHTSNDVNELHAWGLGTTQHPLQQQQPQQQQKLLHQQQQQQQQKPQRMPVNTAHQQPPQQRPLAAATALHKQHQLQQQQQQQQNYLKTQQASSHTHTFNPFLSQDKQSNIFATTKLKNVAYAAPPQRHAGNPPPPQLPPSALGGLGVSHNLAAAGGGPAGAAFGPGIAAQIAAQYDPARNNAQPQLSPEIKEAIRIQAEQRIVEQQQKILEHQPFVQDGQPLYPKNYDPFYSPILLKIDKIVEQLGVTDDLCKERLVCSMYKDPTRYSPHSNFVSAELSRDTSELEAPTNTNETVLRFYRLIQAARDGQDQKDCLSQYPQCSINTE